jgi:hypothetical protein
MQLLLGELLIRTHRFDEALAVLTQAFDSQLAYAGKDHYLRESHQTALWRAIAVDALNGATQATEQYELARTIGSKCLPADHPDLLRIRLLGDYADWRATHSQLARTQALVSLERYKKVMRLRADRDALSVLEGELTRAQSPTNVLSNLLSLMNH